MKRHASQLHHYFSIDPDELSYHLASLFFKAEQRATRPRGLIVPHDPVSLSGYVAAKAYLSIRRYANTIDRVILLANHPSVQADYLVSSGARCFCSPLGDVDLDKQSVNVAAQQGLLTIQEEVYANALSLDVQIPFLQLCLSRFSIVPILVGDNAQAALHDLLDQIWSERSLLVVCSNLSQGIDYPDACAFDKATSDAICANHELAINQSTSATHMLNMLSLYWKQNKVLLKMINYQHSYEVNPDHKPYTGYGSWMLY
ncbi:AmmeMemoRadiSam system protein B [Saccharobesus litoralis]|uniref:AmmeMemoRadiSam system protein B n=1 Tax=Saccharobesus litoralis TaxID=2172099 RepID=A0A2S0VRU5_9ALTE|nr:AmmeMemoRadiSam system protein B [Saccharobesus litoralis]AWB66945.1 AmmeMemoRadiSam system protein B [Saccharobesus litoralis]